MATSQAISSLSRPFGSRAIHLRILPRPESIAETHEIMRLLSIFSGSEIEYYKNLRYERLCAPTAAIVILQKQGSAETLLKKSPLRFTMETNDDGSAQGSVAEDDHRAGSMGQQQQQQQEIQDPPHRGMQQLRQQAGPSRQGGGLSARVDDESRRALGRVTKAPLNRGQPFNLPTSDHSDSSKSKGGTVSSDSSSSSSSSSRLKTREFQVQINRSRYNHRDKVDYGPFHGSFAVDTKTFVQQDLANKVPLLGQSDINIKKSEKPWRVLAWQKAREETTRLSVRDLYEQTHGVSSSQRAPDRTFRKYVSTQGYEHA